MLIIEATHEKFCGCGTAPPIDIRMHGQVIPLAKRALGFAVLWAILTDGTGWRIGFPIVCLAVAASSFPITARAASRLSLAGLARFIPYFAWSSLRGGVDVAARALSPKLPINPAVVRYQMGLESVEARVLMANTVTLLPGTLSVDLRENVLLVHVLNTSSSISALLDVHERHIRALFRTNNKVAKQ